jgi:hypothetical protein
MNRSELIKQKILEAFDDVPRPDLKAVRELGCCEEHDSDFDWYRRHSRQEFEKELSRDYLDRFEFFALHPVAYHYFAPGLLLGTLESIVTDTDSLRSAWEWDWVRNLLGSASTAERFREEYLPLFTAPQRDAVASFLEFFNEWDVDREGYSDRDNKDIERSLNEVWRVAS